MTRSLRPSRPFCDAKASRVSRSPGICVSKPLNRRAASWKPAPPLPSRSERSPRVARSGRRHSKCGSDGWPTSVRVPSPSTTSPSSAARATRTTSSSKIVNTVSFSARSPLTRSSRSGSSRAPVRQHCARRSRASTTSRCFLSRSMRHASPPRTASSDRAWHRPPRKMALGISSRLWAARRPSASRRARR